MTPRALLTTIGATAVAFAVAIGVAAGSGYGENTSRSSRIALAALPSPDRVSDDWPAGAPAEGQRLASVKLSDRCAIAV